MEPRVTPIDATLGAVVTGLALAQMSPSTWALLPPAPRRPVGHVFRENQ